MKRVAFITGTRADFGKIKPLLEALHNDQMFDLSLFVTGMHMMEEYGYTLLEVQRAGFGKIHTFENHTSEASMELTLAKTIEGFSSFVKLTQPELIVVHGDRVEALAGAIVGSLNNILVGHIEGGELSGTIDDLIRHSVSKLSHAHFVANEDAMRRLIQMGESKDSIAVIGSPDIDVMMSGELPDFKTAQAYYDLKFDNYGLGIFHPVTTEIDALEDQIQAYIQALDDSEHNFLLVYPNNDMGSRVIINHLEMLENNNRFRILPSLRFEYFLTLLKHAQFMIGNSSAGIREAPIYGVPTVNIGTRQQNRSMGRSLLNAPCEIQAIVDAIHIAARMDRSPSTSLFGRGDSSSRFMKVLEDSEFWEIQKQKPFIDLPFA